MGIWGGIKNVGSALKSGVTGVGHAVGSVASNPWVQGLTAAGLAATGIGAPLAAGIMAAERGGGALLKPGGNIGDGLKGAATGAAMGAGASLAGSAIRDPGSIIGGLKTVGGKLGGSAGSLGSAAGNVLHAATGGGGGVNPLMLALAGAQGLNAANLGRKANDFADQGWNLANDNWNARAPLRDAGMAGLLHPETRDLSNLTALRNQNPAQKRVLAGLPTGGA